MLTDAQLRRLKPREKPFKAADSNGLYLHVSPAGGRVWRYRYRFGGREKLLTIGEYPMISLSEARAVRDQARRALIEGRDPAALKRQNRLKIESGAHSFEAVARDWLAQVKAPQVSARHAADILRVFERDIFREIGDMQVAEIEPPDALAALRRIESRGAVETAHRVRGWMSEVFVFAIASGIARNDPAAIVKGALLPVTQRGRQPAVTSLGGVREVLARGEGVPAYPQVRLALRLLALTAKRPGEVRAARVSEFEDLDGPAPLWIIPAERMKMKRDFVEPLSPAAAEVVRVAIRLAGRGELLFPSPRRSKIPISENAIGYLLNRAGYHNRHVPHGFRASFSTILNEKFPERRDIIDFALAHAPRNKVEAAYNRALYLDERRELAGLWADMLLEGFEGAETLLDGPIKVLRR